MRHAQHYKTQKDMLVGGSVSQRPGIILLGEKHWSYIQRRYCMSPRELQVAALVCQGLTNEDVAEMLKMRPGTVKTHLRSIFGKTRARNKITLLLIFVQDVNEFFRESGVSFFSSPYVKRPAFQLCALRFYHGDSHIHCLSHDWPMG